MTIPLEFKTLIYIESMLEIIINNMDIKPDDSFKLKVVKEYLQDD